LNQRVISTNIPAQWKDKWELIKGLELTKLMEVRKQLQVFKRKETAKSKSESRNNGGGKGKGNGREKRKDGKKNNNQSKDELKNPCKLPGHSNNDRKDCFDNPRGDSFKLERQKNRRGRPAKSQSKT